MSCLINNSAVTCGAEENDSAHRSPASFSERHADSIQEYSIPFLPLSVANHQISVFLCFHKGKMCLHMKIYRLPSSLLGTLS